jgi:NADP-dependent 3-hydroxy acid dehydrogenase YdfG
MQKLQSSRAETAV